MGLYTHMTAQDIAKGGEAAAVRKKIRAGWKALPLMLGAQRDKRGRLVRKDLPVRHATMGDATKMLAWLQGRTKALLAPESRAAVRANTFIDEARNQLENEDALKSKAEMMNAAVGGDEAAKAMLAAAVVRTTGALLMPSATWMGFLETVTLGENDQFFLESMIPVEVGVEHIGPDGRAQPVPAHQHFSFEHVLLSYLSSDEYEFPLYDPVHGNVREASLAVIDMARDLALKIDFMVRAFHLVGATGSRLTATFDLANADLSKRDYVAHSVIETGNFPAGNIITLNDNSAASGPRLNLLRAIVAYCTQWGSGAFRDGDLVPTAIHVPSADAYRFLDEADADSRADTYGGEVKDMPFQISFGGYRFTIIPDNTITGNYATVRMNKPTGFFVEKPGGDRAFSDESYEAQKQNLGRVSEQKLNGQAYPRHWKPNVLAVRYRT